MSDDKWKIDNEVHGREDSLRLNTLADGVTLNPQRALMHEIIVQAVTERKIFDHANPNYDVQFYEKFENLKNSEAYQNLVQKGSFTREDVTKLLDQAGYEKLPQVPTAQHTTAMVTGGPATGKSNIAEALRRSDPAFFEGAARVNPDDYKAVLASPEEYGRAFADVAHNESSVLAQKILGRMEEKIQAGQAPNVILDVVSPNQSRMNLANQSQHLVVMVGTLPPEQALDRSYARFLETGRQTPTEVVLGGAQKASKLTPVVLDHNDLNMRIYSTDVPKGQEPRLVASWDPEKKALNVHDPDSFIDFVERQNIDPKATSPSELYPKGRTAETIADNLSEYTSRGAKVNFLNSEGKVAMSVTPSGVEKNGSLSSKRGNDFFEHVGQSHETQIKKGAQQSQATPAEPAAQPQGQQQAQTAPQQPTAEAPTAQTTPVQPAEVIAEPVAQTPPAPVADNASASLPVEAPKQPDVPSDSSADQQQQARTHQDVVDAASKNPDGVAVSPENKTAVIENSDKTKYQVEGNTDGTSKVTKLDVDGKALSSVDLDVGSTQKLAKSVPELKGVIGNVIGPVIIAGVALASGATPAQAGEAAIDSVVGNTVKAVQKDPTVTGVATGVAKDAVAAIAPEAVEAVNQDKSTLEVVGAAAEDGAKWAGCAIGGAGGAAAGGLISSPTVLGVPVGVGVGAAGGCAAGSYVVDKAIDGGKAVVGAVVDYFTDDEQVVTAPQDVKNHGNDVSAVLPAGATLTVQSSSGDASVTRGVTPDNQIKVMQKDGETSATITEMDRQRVLEQERAAQLAAQQQQNQQTAPAQMAGR